MTPCYCASVQSTTRSFENKNEIQINSNNPWWHTRAILDPFDRMHFVLRFAAAIFLYQVFATKSASKSPSITFENKGEKSPNEIVARTWRAPVLGQSYEVACGSSFDDAMDEEEHRRLMWAAGIAKDHRTAIRLLYRDGGERLLMEMHEAFNQCGKPECQAEALFFLNHCNCCRDQATNNVIDAMEKIREEAIVREGVRLFELGLDHEINDLYLFITQPAPVTRLIKRLHDNPEFFTRLLLTAVRSRLRMGVRRLLQMRGAAEAVEQLVLYNRMHRSVGIDDELEYIEAVRRADIQLYDNILSRLHELSA